MKLIELQREAVRRLPVILSEILDQDGPVLPVRAGSANERDDILVDVGGRRWRLELKPASSPGTVADVASSFDERQGDGALPVLLVPYMTQAGAKAAEQRRLNWIDLAGNAHLRDGGLHVWVRGRPNKFKPRGRPASAFAPKSSRVARVLLLEPERWWRQKDLSDRTDLDAGRVSRIVKRLEDDRLLERDGPLLRPRDRDLLLDAWVDEYRFSRHDTVTGHHSGNGIDLARDLGEQLRDANVRHAFTGLPAAWALDQFARFRLASVYVVGDPRDAADILGLRRDGKGANVQLIGPDDWGVLEGAREVAGIRCVSPVQIYLDLANLPERAAEAAEQMRTVGSLWHAES
jgi:hypothetical protein